jgi:ribosomal protein S18 acetylase RimI-like enzyme
METGRTAIRPERPDTADARSLIEELEAELSVHYAPVSRHGYSVQKLIDQGVAFFVTRYDGAPAGCGGIQVFGTDYGELKRMYVRPQFRGLGLGWLMLSRLEEYAREHDIGLVRLETGIYQEAAIRMYERSGYVRIPPFPPYFDDPVSRCYERRIT